MARHSSTPPYRRERSALAWLTTPRTSAQVAALLGITPNHASALCGRLVRRGKVHRRPISGCQYVYEVRR